MRFLFASLALFAACDTSSSDPGRAPIEPGCPLALIGSDYLSTAVSLLHADGTLCADTVLDSGSRPVGVVTAFSGDVVIPRSPHPDGWLVLLDRFPNGVLTFVGGDDGAVVGQLAVGTGYAANPQTVLFLDAGKAYVSRLADNPTPTAAAEDFDEGGDLLVLDVTDARAPKITGRVDLRGYADEGMEARPEGLVRVGGLVWAALGNLGTDFDRAGSGRLVAIDPATDAVTQALDLPDVKNCGKLVAGPKDRLWVACTGVFAAGSNAQAEASALIVVDAATAPAKELWRRPVEHIRPDLPLGFAIAPLGADRAFIVSFGRLGVADDALFVVDLAANTATDTGVRSAPFQFGQLLLEGDRLLVSDASPQKPRIRRFSVTPAGALSELPASAAGAGAGLPPRDLARFR